MSFLDKITVADPHPAGRPANDEPDARHADADLPKEIRDQLKALIESLDRYAA